MFDKLAAPIFGGLLALGGVLAMVAHTRAWRRQREDPVDDEVDRAHYHARYRRRMQTSGLIALLGVMIAVGDAVVPWQRFQHTFAVYWMIVLLVACWVLLLAVGDLFATKAHSQASLARLRARQRALESQLEKYRGEQAQRAGDERDPGENGRS